METHPELLQVAREGEKVWIARAGRPLVRLVPGTRERRLGVRGSLPVNPETLDAAFCEEAESQVAALLGEGSL